jgi:lactosylceramide 4-alpha-galactosyltransferase
LTCTEPEPSIPELDSDPANFNRDRAFFIETSGSGGLSVRQACAVESLALHNPNLTVYVLFVNVKINTSLDTVQELEKKYNNVHLISINLDDYMAGTALEHWYHCSDWRNGFYVNNLSNGLRLLTRCPNTADIISISTSFPCDPLRIIAILLPLRITTMSITM